MTEDEIIQFVASLPGVVAITASKDNGAPDGSWGNSFFFYDPKDDLPAGRRLPFATLVTQDYSEFDTASNLDRPGMYRLNISVGRTRFQDLVGYAPAMHTQFHDSVDYTARDQVLPHPVYAAQAWVSILNPNETTSELTRSLLIEAHARAVARHRPHR